MMQIQNQTQQISEEEFLFPLSENELVSIAGGFIPDPPQPYDSLKKALDAAERQLASILIARQTWVVSSNPLKGHP